MLIRNKNTFHCYVFLCEFWNLKSGIQDRFWGISIPGKTLRYGTNKKRKFCFREIKRWNMLAPKGREYKIAHRNHDIGYELDLKSYIIHTVQT